MDEPENVDAQLEAIIEQTEDLSIFGILIYLLISMIF
jgi:hypothetical protein